jgi:hypothetical protein
MAQVGHLPGLNQPVNVIYDTIYVFSQVVCLFPKFQVQRAHAAKWVEYFLCP